MRIHRRDRLYQLVCQRVRRDRLILPLVLEPGDHSPLRVTTSPPYRRWSVGYEWIGCPLAPDSPAAIARDWLIERGLVEDR
jgi:hypothetical protein